MGRTVKSYTLLLVIHVTTGWTFGAFEMIAGKHELSLPAEPVELRAAPLGNVTECGGTGDTPG